LQRASVPEGRGRRVVNRRRETGLPGEAANRAAHVRDLGGPAGRPAPGSE
jgi:hypothetical protein